MCQEMLLILRSQSTGSDAIKFEYHGFGTRYRDPAKDFPLLRGFAILGSSHDIRRSNSLRGSSIYTDRAYVTNSVLCRWVENLRFKARNRERGL